jgi:hypothetical protein
MPSACRPRKGMEGDNGWLGVKLIAVDHGAFTLRSRHSVATRSAFSKGSGTAYAGANRFVASYRVEVRLQALTQRTSHWVEPSVTGWLPAPGCPVPVVGLRHSRFCLEVQHALEQPRLGTEPSFQCFRKSTGSQFELFPLKRAWVDRQIQLIDSPGAQILPNGGEAASRQTSFPFAAALDLSRAPSIPSVMKCNVVHPSNCATNVYAVSAAEIVPTH